MKQKDFDRLITSVKQAGAIRRGQLKPGRTTDFRPEDVQAIRTRFKKVATRVRPDDWRQRSDTPELGARTATTRGTSPRLVTDRSKESSSGCQSLDIMSLS